MVSSSLSGSVFSDAAILTFGMQFIGFTIAAILQTEIFYDILGGINFLALAVMSSFALFGDTNANTDNADGYKYASHHGIFVGLFAISRGWLLLFLAWRAHHRKGDSRFDGVKTIPSKFFVYWMVQAVWVYCISLPLLVVAATANGNTNATTNNNNNSNDQLQVRYGLILLLSGMALSIYTEIRSDITKAKWVAKGRPGGFCTDGHWKYSRHPNYAGEILTWVFAAWYAILACDNNWSWTSIVVASISPLFTIQILLNTSGTGVWNAEGKNLKRYYEHEDRTIARNYEAYRRTTPPLFPLITIIIPYDKVPLQYQRLFCFEWERYEYKTPSTGKKSDKNE